MGIARILKNRNRILGLNERYLEYIRPSNLSDSIQIADDKVRTKKVLAKQNLPVPELLGVINNRKELEFFDFDTLPPSFVMKPKNGFEGGGIEIFYNRKNGSWIRGDKSKVDESQLRAMIEDVLDGKYSLHNQPDGVMFEERIKPHKNFRYYTYRGTPDVRVIVFNNVPVMAMVRIPTEKSNGKANLSLGAIGGGLDITAGRITSSILGKQGVIEYVPGTNLKLSGFKIPYWNKILHYAVEAHQISGLGFAAVDFLIDRDRGPMIVELNARPGLSIQLANRDGLKWRLEKVKGLNIRSVEKGIRMGQDLFGGEVEETVESFTGKQIITILEQVTIYGPNKVEETLRSKIDTGADSTSIDKRLLFRLGYREELERLDEWLKIRLEGIDLDSIKQGQAKEIVEAINSELEPQGFTHIDKIAAVFSSHGTSFRPFVKVVLKLADTKFETTASVYDRSNLKYSIIVGRKSLKNFLIRPVRLKVTR